VNWLRRFPLALGAACALALLSTNLYAQGCASCYTTAAAGGPQVTHALRAGILLLVFPPTLIFAGIIITVRRWKNAVRGLPNVTERQPGFRTSDSSVERTE
jgi:hypothetical protein